jgi:translation initiation factor 2B subunit (eIF-2B alpha/beta/delta family)
LPKSISKTAKESSFEKRLRSIVGDRTSGAAEIEEKTLRLFEDIIKGGHKNSRNLRHAVKRIEKRFSSMANILNLTIAINRLFEYEEFGRISGSLEKYTQDIEQNRNKTVARAARRMKSYGSVFTLSGSSMVLRAVLKAGNLGWKGDIRLVESRPKNEGVEFAKTTAKAGFKTVLGVDVQMPDMIRDSGAVFLGADAVTEYYFINKIGSDIAVEYADKYGKTVCIVADRSKFITNKIYKFIPDQNPESEIISKKIKNLEIINNYFEKIIPRGKVHFISGDRVIPATEIKKTIESQALDL